VVENINFKFT